MGPDDTRPPSLEHPLPAGMRDLLPEEAESRRRIARRILDRFALHGYALVTPPAFEFADVLERGLGTLDPDDVLRFVEPESGEVAALRPDVTPQIARMIATRLRDMPAPLRLCYEGTVLRRRSGRARKHRQIPQVGVELAGVPGPDGDLELLALAVDALSVAGLSDFTVDLGDAGIVRALLEGAPPDVTARVGAALARKDEVALGEIAAAGPLPNGPLLQALLSLHGGREVLAEGAARLAGSPAEAALARLTRLVDAAAPLGLGARLTVDLGEVRGFAYYTGPIFHLFAPGPGEAIGSGGRYDELLTRFGVPMPAVGFALDLDRIAWALRDAGVRAAPAPRVLVVGAHDDPRLAALRASGVPSAAHAEEGALAYARAWRYSHLLAPSGAGSVDSVLVDVRTGARSPWRPGNPIA